MDAAEERVNVLFLSFVSSYWRKLLIPTVAIATLAAFLLFPRGQSPNEVVGNSDSNPFLELIEEPENEVLIEAPPTILVVDVKGAVRHPGVYTMQEGDRLIDAISAAGGYLPEADSRSLNHAMKLADEFVIYVPVEGEEPPEEKVNIATGSPEQADDGMININTADESQLTTIPGIGPAKAAAILAYRDEHGPFKATSELMNISGIGQKTFDKLEHAIKVK